MNTPFWPNSNAWWRAAAKRMAAGTATPGDWDEANRRVWCLVKRLPPPEACRLTVQDQQDLVQTVLLKLLQPAVVHRLAEVDTPAHYLARMMANHLRSERTRTRARSRAMKRHAGLVQPAEDLRPDQIAAWAELKTRARYVVNHRVSAGDRKTLWWFYKDELSVREIGRRLGCSEAAALQRLSRARKRVRDLLSE